MFEFWFLFSDCEHVWKNTLNNWSDRKSVVHIPHMHNLTLPSHGMKNITLMVQMPLQNWNWLEVASDEINNLNTMRWQLYASNISLCVSATTLIRCNRKYFLSLYFCFFYGIFFFFRCVCFSIDVITTVSMANLHETLVWLF